MLIRFCSYLKIRSFILYFKVMMSNTQGSSRSNNSSKKKRAAPFDDNEEKQLVLIWASEAVQRKFKNNSRHNFIHEYIAKEHNKSGQYNRTSSEILTKIKNCKKKYTLNKPKSGDPPPTWPSYYIMHQILGQKDSCTLEFIDDSLSTRNNEFQIEDELLQLEQEAVDEDESQEGASGLNSDLDIHHLQTPQNIRQFQRIARPPRREQSKEAEILATLAEDRRIEDERFKQVENRHARAEERENQLTSVFGDFLSVASMYLKCALKEKGYSPSNNAAANNQCSLNNRVSLSLIDYEASTFTNFSPATSPSKDVPLPVNDESSGVFSLNLHSSNELVYDNTNSSIQSYGETNLNSVTATTSSEPPCSPTSALDEFDPSKLKIPPFMPVEMKVNRNIEIKEGVDKSVSDDKPKKSKFELKVKSSIPFRGKYRIQKTLSQNEPQNKKKESYDSNNNNLPKENFDDFLSILDESLSSDCESSIAYTQDVEKSPATKRMKNTQTVSPLRECTNDQSSSPKNIKNQFWKKKLIFKTNQSLQQ